MARVAVLCAWLAGVAALGGCELVFPPSGIHADAGVPPDGGGADATEADADLQHNEDGDALVDAVDPCPHLAGDAADADSDGIGDLCDREPSLPNQHRFYFNGFGSGLDGLVAGPSSDVAVAGDVVALTGQDGLVTLYLPAVIGYADVFTQFRVGGKTMGEAVVELSVVVGHPTGSDTIDGASCRVGRTLAMPNMVLFQNHFQTSGTDTGLTTTMVSGALVGYQAKVEYSVDPMMGTMQCATPAGLLLDSAPLSLGEVGLAADRVNVQFDYLFVVESLPP